MIQVWPKALPCQPLLQGLEVNLDDNFDDFKPSQGKPFRRTKQSVATDSYTVQFAMTNAQRDLFMEFYRNDCGGGVDDFSVPKDYLRPSRGSVIFSWSEGAPKLNRAGPDQWVVSFAVTADARDSYL